MKHTHLIVHYAEIGIKGKNRFQFESLLMNNIASKLGDLIETPKRSSGQINIQLKDSSKDNLDSEQYIKKISGIVSKIPGIAYFSFAEKISLNNLEDNIFECVKKIEFESFKLNTKRRNKTYKHNSVEINKIAGELICEKLNKKADMKTPDIIIKIEVTDKDGFVSLKDIEGVGGLPSNSKQKVISLLSGGIDSPVASYLMMKRGCEVVFVHFQNENQITRAVENKIKELAEILSQFQQKTNLYIVPFGEIQKDIIMKVRPDKRMLIYRRIMLKLASDIADKENSKFLIVGDSLSQVASQTLENLDTTYSNSPKPILSPLIGMDKKEIIAISRKIGTYETSVLPYGDCCSYFLPKHPALKARKSDLDTMQETLDVSVMNKAVENSKVLEF